MKRGSSLGFVVMVIGVAIACGAGLASQWRQTMSLRSELDLARMQTNDLERLQAENARLRAHQISNAELERLRADHAALSRLRLELETWRKNVPVPSGP
jgi:uncharacterized protein HemX